MVLVFVKVGVTVLIGYVGVAETSIMVVMGIDLGVYVLCLVLIDLGKARTHLGTLGSEGLSGPLPQRLMRTFMRTITDITFTLLIYNAHIQLLWDQGYWFELALRIITYRSYKRAIYTPLDWSIHLSFLLSLIFASSISVFWIPLLMIPLPDFPSMQIFSAFTIPKKNLHRNEGVYKALYLLASMIGFAVCLASAGLLEPIMLFGLPVFLWSIPYYRDSQYSAQGK